MRTRRAKKASSFRLAGLLLTSRDVAPMILGFCGEAVWACRLLIALGRRGSALREILTTGLMNDLLAEACASGCSRRGLACVDRWTSRLESRCKDLVRWLSRGVRGHGEARVPPAWIEADERVCLVSLPAVEASCRDGRVVFAVCASDQNLCDSGCWCTGKETQTLCCFVPATDATAKGRRRRRKRAVLTPLVAVASRYGRGATGGPPAVWAAAASTCDVVADALGVDTSDLGLVVKFLFVAASDRGGHRWRRLEQLHNSRFFDDDDDDSDPGDPFSLASLLFDGDALLDDDDDFFGYDHTAESDHDTDDDDDDSEDDSDDGDDGELEEEEEEEEEDDVPRRRFLARGPGACVHGGGGRGWQDVRSKSPRRKASGGQPRVRRRQAEQST